METNNHNQEIVNSRVGGFGGSDAKMFLKVGDKGLSALSATDIKRIQVAKGMADYEPIPSTPAMELGHMFEDWFADNRKEPNFYREVRLERQLGTPFSTFAHADFASTEDGLEVVELKCTKDVSGAIETYWAQLQWYYLLGASKVTLVVQPSGNEFGVGMQITEILRSEPTLLMLERGIELVAGAWGEVCNEPSVVDVTEMLPFDSKMVQDLCHCLSTIEELTKKADEFKKNILSLMEQGGIKKITNDLFSITYIAPSERVTFDRKALEAKYPNLNTKQFEKVSKVKSSIKISVRK